jgi:hypothetical protein
MADVEQVKALGKGIALWSITNSTAKIIVSQLEQDDRPVMALPMRDVWISGARFRGIRPTVCLTLKRLVAVSHPGILSRGISETLDRASIVSVSSYDDRAFSMNLSDGRVVKLRGLIGTKKGFDVHYERLYSEISSGVKRTDS